MPDNTDYQVTQADKDLLTLSQRLNVDYQQLKQANPSIKSISPGQFINIPTKQTFTGVTPGNIKPVVPKNTPTGSFLSGGGTLSLGVTPPKQSTPKAPQIPQLAQQYANQYINSMQQASQLNPKVYSGPNSFTRAGGQVPTAQLQYNINAMVAAGQLPKTIPTGTSIINPQTGQPASQQEMQSNGYVYNNFTKSWELGGTGLPPQTQTTPDGQQTPTPAYLQIVNYNGTSMPAWEAELRAKKAAGVTTRALSSREQRQQQIRNKRAKDAAYQAQLNAKNNKPVEVRNDTGSTVLSLRLGS